ncbi:MAG TPA: sigma 54-interacting transcriptional regulator, partial [Terriglobales bacterium]|nr:sigma 54-interacting transcriptional regulator [Terriglobales bacterium]
MQFVCSGEDSGRSGPMFTDRPAITPELMLKIFNAPNVGFAMWDEQLHFLYVNDALAKMHGVPPAAHYGRTVREILGNAAPTIEAALRKVFTTGESVSNFELIATLPSRQEPGRWIGNFFPIAGDEKKIRCVGVAVIELGLATHAQSEQTSEAHTNRREAFFEFTGAMASARDEEDLLPAMAAFIRKAFPHDFSSITLYEKSVRQLRAHTLSWPGQEGQDGELVPVIESAYGPTFLHGEIKIHSRGSMAASHSPFLERLSQAGIQSVCLLPLISRKGTLGTLNLGWTAEHAIDTHAIQLLKHVAAQVALAIDSVAAYREIQELTQTLNKENIYLQSEIRSDREFDEIVGESPVLHRVLGQVQTVAPSDATVLILGETGTGKELIARAIHRLSSRKAANFVKLNCAAIPTGLLESELFGHEKGAFTGAISQKTGRLELADGGTLFLDEVGEIPLELQPKLLRVLQDQEFERLGSSRTIKVDIRLVAATNRDLAKSVNAREFRSDLFYRLHVFPVQLPALRERAKDIPLLVRYFVQKFAKRMNKTIETIPEEA